MKAARVPVLSLVILIAAATPAAAGPLLAAVDRPWHYWLSVVLVASVLGLLGLLVVGYLVRVIMAKYGIRVGRRSTG